jgi:hypothetical protein
MLDTIPTVIVFAPVLNHVLLTVNEIEALPVTVLEVVSPLTVNETMFVESASAETFTPSVTLLSAVYSIIGFTAEAHATSNAVVVTVQFLGVEVIPSFAEITTRTALLLDGFRYSPTSNSNL